MHRHHHRYKIPKTLRHVTLWVHPEGRVTGALFLNFHTKNGAGVEDPYTVINEASEFLVLQRTDPEGLRFYNKRAIVRVEYEEEPLPHEEGLSTLCCQLLMMDGSLIEGTVRHLLPPGRSRLYDYLNLHDARFVKLYLSDGGVCVVNKSYIVCASHLIERHESETPWLPDAVEIDIT
ncbi:MAG: hypothetical protein FJZ47_09165 [Candidatus Tectomicrobia bacterium]|uniref:Uncharacterized protein n=1 Tax=Tectimicrobiota bacterium TaxID=2528274 RepID=A0A937VZG6_UNCTE|nr:hypothetical protein [Candidatus Tectomicrobia bacterium]